MTNVSVLGICFLHNPIVLSPIHYNARSSKLKQTKNVIPQEYKSNRFTTKPTVYLFNQSFGDQFESTA